MSVVYGFRCDCCHKVVAQIPHSWVRIGELRHFCDELPCQRRAEMEASAEFLWGLHASRSPAMQRRAMVRQ